MYVYESSSSEWRGLASPAKEQGLAEVASAVVFQDVLFVVFNTLNPRLDEDNTVCSLLSYNLQEDMWRVLNVDIPRAHAEYGPVPHVFACNNELWMTRSHHNPEDDDYFEDPEENLFFEAANIRITKYSSVEIRTSVETADGFLRTFF